MKRININELHNHIGEEVLIKGWVFQFRELSKISFLILRERTGYCQVVLPRMNENITNESVVEIVGMVKKEPQSKYSGLEIKAKSLKIISKSRALPVVINREENIPFNTLNLYRPVSLRKEKERCIFKIQSEFIWAYREYLRSQGFTEIQSTKLSKAGLEGGSELFEVNYFEEKMYLTQSPQFYKQMMVGVYERVFEIGKVYRAEGSNSNRHLTEFIGLEYEIGFIENVEEVMQVEENAFEYIFNHLNNVCKNELEYLNVGELKFKKIPRLEYLKCLEILGPEYKKTGLNNESEKIIGEWVLKNLESEFCVYYKISII